jgi:sulfite reductase alpha subunit-like flavoprotein
MPQAVRKAVESILQKINSWTDEELEAYMLEMETSGRWIEETW